MEFLAGILGESLAASKSLAGSFGGNFCESLAASKSFGGKFGSLKKFWREGSRSLKKRNQICFMSSLVITWTDLPRVHDSK